MPYMTRPDTEIPLWYGVKLVKQGELVLVNDSDVDALLAEGWKLGIPIPTNDTATEPEKD